ncbi:MAG: hypothetical protein GY862_13375 [Gammaproteobacteria bacterium]|nr:hypothetical protein [Gammaproteobacteria bacterium]
MAKTRAQIQREYRKRKAEDKKRTVTLILPQALIDRIEMDFPGEGISDKMTAALYEGTRERMSGADEVDYTDIAEDIETVLDGIPDTRGDGKHFIADMYQHVKRLYPRSKTGVDYMHMDEFKWRLLQAHKARNLRLTRLDLVTPDNEQSGIDSEICDGLATYHFIELQGDKA